MLATRFGGWDCAANRYEQFGEEGLACRGLKDILVSLIDKKDLEAFAFRKYGHEKSSQQEKENKVIKTLGGSLGNQFRNKFEPIYSLFNGPKVFKDDFEDLNNTFKIKPNLESKIDKAKCYSIASKREELIQSLTEKEREFVLSL